MEIGSLAEWLTGISELLAVCTALSLPLISENKKKKSTAKKLTAVAKSMGGKIIQEKREDSGKKIEKIESYQHFKEYLDILCITCNDSAVIAKVTNMNHLLLSIKPDNSNLESISHEIEENFSN